MMENAILMGSLLIMVVVMDLMIQLVVGSQDMGMFISLTMVKIIEL
jgi:hypothetical protein